MEPALPPRRPRLTALDGALALIGVLLVVQIWLLTATLEAFLAGQRDSALPAAILSGVLFLASLALYLFVERLDAGPRPE